ncbi:MAG: hypothetical protein AAF184_23350 [Pseudomonadota bacterium]
MALDTLRPKTLTHLLLAATMFAGASQAAINVGTLQHDGPATPEQLSLLLPITGATDAGTSAAVRYKEQSASDWIEAHSLYRIQPSATNAPAVGEVLDAFAWPIIGLNPGTTYDVEVTLDDGVAPVVRTATMTTRALPGAAPPATVTLNATMSFDDIQDALNAVTAGDVIEFQDGTYQLPDFLSITGARDAADTEAFNATAVAPIYVRGESRDGVILQSAPTGSPGPVIRLERHINHFILENMTIRGVGVDGSSQRGILGNDGRTNTGGDSYNNITFRNLTITEVDRGIQFVTEAQGVLVYNNTVIGNNIWTSAFVDTNLTWTDDGLNVPGSGNVYFNNTVRGFGDSFSVASHSGNDTNTYSFGIHIYRNDARNSGDDFFEADHGHRNISFYDNRSHNSMTFLSLDPLYGGPLLVARNTAINIGRQPHKWNDQNSGNFVYNNTVVVTTMTRQVAGWIQDNNGPTEYYGVRNNILIWTGVGTDTLRISNRGHSNVDFSHNCWYPDGRVQFDGVFDNFAEAERDVPPTNPIFSGLTKRFTAHSICERNPFVTEIVLGSDYLTEVTQTYWPELRANSGASGNGIAIANITDGFTGAAPDRGAAITGIGQPDIGDLGESGIGTTPKPPTNLSVN